MGNVHKNIKKLKYIYFYLPLIIISLFLTNCDQPFTLSNLLDGPTKSMLTLSPTVAQVVNGDSLNLEAAGGQPPYTYSLLESLNGSGELLNGSIYTAPTDTTGNVKVQVSDSYGILSTAVITVIIPSAPASLSISPLSLSIFQGNSITLNASGGMAPYTYSLTTAIGGTGELLSGSQYTAPSDSTGTAIITVEDNLGATTTSSITVNNSILNVVYDNVLVNNTGLTIGGSSIDGNFSFDNSGAHNGTAALNWEVYVSLDTNIGAGDSLIDSGTTPALNSGTSSSSLAFTGNWPIPSVITTYYLIAKITSTEDITNNDNTGNTSVLVSVPAPNDIDYIVNIISNAPNNAVVGTANSQTFVYRNRGSDAGVFTSYWTAYISEDQILDGSDTILDNGSESSLGALSNSGTINISGNWPTSAGLYYILVNISSGDDINPSNNYSSSASFTIYESAAVIEYDVNSLTRNYPTVTAGSFISETFDIVNLGGSNGVQNLSWTAYLSSDNSLETASDLVIASSGGTTVSPLNSGSSHSSLSISGNWPSTPGDYYLFIDINASDDVSTSNNVTGNGLYTVKSPPDYIISTASFIPTEGVAGNVLGIANDYEFVIKENANSNGSQMIGWQVFTSIDTILDGSDTMIKNGSLAALGSGLSSSSILFHDSNWPSAGRYYYVIITISAGDDKNPVNNSYVSPTRIAVPRVYNEGGENNSSEGPVTGSLSNVSHMAPTLSGGVLSQRELLKIEGINDIRNDFDTYEIVLDSDVTSLEMYAQWAINDNEIDLFLWDENNNKWEFKDTGSYTEPSTISPPATISGLTAGDTYYIGVKFKKDSMGNTYDLWVHGNP